MRQKVPISPGLICHSPIVEMMLNIGPFYFLSKCVRTCKTQNCIVVTSFLSFNSSYVSVHQISNFSYSPLRYLWLKIFNQVSQRAKMYGIFHIRSVSVGLDSQIWYLFIYITGYLNVRKMSETMDFRTFVGSLFFPNDIKTKFLLHLLQ